jgi:hypothetical protein
VICPLLVKRALGRRALERPVLGGETAKAAGPPPDGVPTIEMAAHEHAQASTAAAAALLVDLQHDLIQGDGVVAADDALLLVAQDLIEIVRPDGDEGTMGSAGGRPKVRL